MCAGANAVKLEGIHGHEDVVKGIVESGVPVMGHIGLTPQSIHQLGGFRVQGKDSKAADDLLVQAHNLESAGCFALVLECVPSCVALKISSALRIPTIGIGAGVDADGQVLVLQDLLGMNAGFSPKFLKTYLNGHGLLLDALNRFHHEVVEKKFPSGSESYS